MGLEKTKVIHRIIINKDNPDIVYVAAMAHPGALMKNVECTRLMDGGVSWKRILLSMD